jgi:hypothetical protein
MSACTGCGFTEGHHRPDCSKVAAHPKNNSADMTKAPDTAAKPATRPAIPDHERKLYDEMIDKNPILRQLFEERLAKAITNWESTRDLLPSKAALVRIAAACIAMLEALGDIHSTLDEMS